MLKRLRHDESRDDFEREEKCLRLLNGLEHPNIVPFWGSYTYKNEYYFLFKHVETDLNKFLLSERRHWEFKWDFTFYAALTGLASALARTHRLVLKEEEHGIGVQTIGYHHDLRPPNVLVSHDKFILADFGLGRLKDAESQSLTLYKPINGYYIAPECTNAKEVAQTVNRAIDVWAFCCLLLEVVTYMRQGADGIRNFRKARFTSGRLDNFEDSVFYQARDGGEVKHEVSDWVAHLKRDSTTTPTDNYLLNLSLDGLRAKPEERLDMDKIHRRLEAVSMLKHFDSVQNMLPRVRDESVPPASHAALPTKCLRRVEERLAIWGQVLCLHETDTFTHRLKSPAKAMELVTSLFHILRSESDKRASENSTSLGSFHCNDMDRKIQELWQLLPSDLFDLANNHLCRANNDNGLHEQISRPSDLPHEKMLHECDHISCDILLGNFERFEKSFNNDLPESMSLDELLRTKSVGDVYDLTDDLQRGQKLFNLQKIERSLQRLRTYTEMMGNTVGGSTQYVALVWGPLGFLLRRSSEFDKAHIAIIDAITKLGEALPDFHAKEAFFGRSPHSKEILVLLFKDILNFYGVMLKPFTHSGNHPNPPSLSYENIIDYQLLITSKDWTYKFKPLWPMIRALISEISRHISRLTLLMRTEPSIEHIHREYEFRDSALDNFREQARDSRQQEFDRIKTSLRPREYSEALDYVRGVRSPGTGDWLFKNKAYIDWSHDSQGKSRVLWLRGIPGAGG